MKENLLSKEKIIEIQNNVDIVDVISGYVPLITKGKNFFGVCPFHADHSPSMSVSREKQIYKCFSCGASGNVFNFVMDYENISFMDALKKVSNLAGININIASNSKSSVDKDRILYEIIDVSKKLYKNNINTEVGEAARNFIKNRHFDLSIIKEFELGLSLSSYDQLTNLLIKKKYKIEDIVRTGLVMKGDKGYKDVYLNRIMFPLYDLNGKTVGYSGRIYNGEDISKYFNTKETEIFKKGELLYNYHKAKDVARKTGKIIIVEGFFALIRLHTIGIDNVIATLGTALTKKQALIIKRMAPEVILCYDGDSAGNNATDSASKIFNDINVTPKVVRLEDNLDPDDYVLKYGKQKMLDKLNNPINIMEYKLNYHKLNKNLSNNFDMSNYVNEMLDEIKKINDDVYKELTIKKLSDESNLSVEFLKSKLENQIQETKPKIVKKVKLNKYDQAETHLLYYMLSSKDVIKKYINSKPIFKNEQHTYLANSLVNYLKNNNDVNMSSVMTYYMEDDKIMETIHSLNMLDIKDEFKMAEIDDYIRVLKERVIKIEKKNIKDKIAKDNDIEKQKELISKMIEIRKGEIENEKNSKRN